MRPRRRIDDDVDRRRPRRGRGWWHRWSTTTSNVAWTTFRACRMTGCWSSMLQISVPARVSLRGCDCLPCPCLPSRSAHSSLTPSKDSVDSPVPPQHLNPCRQQSPPASLHRPSSPPIANRQTQVLTGTVGSSHPPMVDGHPH